MTAENRFLLDELKANNATQTLKNIRNGFLRALQLDEINQEDREIVQEINDYLVCR